MLSLAVALETAADALSGLPSTGPPGGHTHPVTEPRIEHIDAGECMRLLVDGGVGRLVFTSHHGPGMVPVNLTTYEGAVVFRTAHDNVIARQIGTDVGSRSTAWTRRCGRAGAY